MNAKSISELVKSILFPISCASCGEEGQWWCRRCRKICAGEAKSQCPVCARPTAAGAPCQSCRAASSLDGVAVFFNYAPGSPPAELIRQFKYSYATDMMPLWREIISDRLAADSVLKNCLAPGTALIPVPLHRRRERERGFNQARLIARALGEASGLLVEENLRRGRYTSQQAKLTRPERLENVADAFLWPGSLAAPEQVALVDDVFTTGATMQECARVLKLRGAKRIVGIALARD